MSPSSKFTGQLAGKSVVVICGSSGIGFGIAQGLVEEGARVIISSSSQEKVDKAISQLNDAKHQYNADPQRVSGHAANLIGPEAEASLVELFKKVGKFDHLVYSAGDAPKALPLKEHTFETISSAGQVRFVSALLAVKTAVYGGYLQQGGSIVLTRTRSTSTLCPTGPSWLDMREDWQLWYGPLHSSSVATKSGSMACHRAPPRRLFSLVRLPGWRTSSRGPC